MARPFHKKNPNKIHDSKFDVTVSVLNIVLLFLLVVIIAFPLLSFFSLGFSNSAYNSQVIAWPKGFTMWAFKYILTDDATYFWRSFLNSVIITFTITVVSNLVEALAAYPLSKSDCPLKGGIMMYFIITMLFSAGIIPAYLLMYQLNLLNTIWSVIFISINNVGNLLYFKVYFEGLPADIEDAARIDGANEIQMFFLIVVPMALPVIGSCCFFSIVGAWNSYGTALLFISASSTDAHPLAYYVYLLMGRLKLVKNDPDVVAGINNLQSAAMLLTIIPILCIYPYVIRYIKSGIAIGSVKG